MKILCKRLFLFVASLALMPGFLMAEKLSQAEAMRLAESFAGQFSTVAATARRAARQVENNGSEVAPERLIPVPDGPTADALYIFNRGQNKGFVIVASDSRAANPIVGYADEGHFDADNMPLAMKEWLQFYVREAQAPCKAAPQTARTMAGTQMAQEELPEQVEPLLGDIAWAQGVPYNRLTPLINGNHALTGCVATATAQIMYYHRWPETGTGSFTYEDLGSGQTLTADFSQHTYDWDAMSPQYDENTPKASGDAVALLMSDVGIALRMNYSLSFSGAFTEDVETALRDYFGYDQAVFAASRRQYSHSAWTNLMKRELASGRPVVYSGSQASADGGHAFVCDGYKADGYFHFNWGWSGAGNGWFLLSTMNPDGSDGYTEEQEMVCNIARPGEAGETPEANFSWEFDANTGTLSISGEGDMPEYEEGAEGKPWYVHHDRVTKVIIGEGITSITISAFEGYSNLSSVSFPKSLEFIHSSAFCDCPISSVQFPDNLTAISGYAFKNTHLEHIVLGSKIQQVVRAFAGISTLKDITVSADNPYLASVDGALYDKGITTLYQYPGIKRLTTLPSTVTSIYLGAFEGSGVEEIVLPDNVRYLEDYALSFVQTLKRVVLPSKLREICSCLFIGDENLEEVVMGKRITSIGGWAFNGCSSLKSLTLHAGVSNIGECAFFGCNQLSQLTCMALEAPQLGDQAFLMLPYQGVLTVPEGSDYSAWLEQLGPGWTVVYTSPEEPDPNAEWTGTVRAGYVSDGTIWSDNPLSPMYAYFYNDLQEISVWSYGTTKTYDCAIRIDNAANPLARALDIPGQSLRGISFMGAKLPSTVISGKVWISTALPATADEADILVADIKTDFVKGEWNDVLFDGPVTLPKGPCHVGVSLVTVNDGLVFWPFQFQSLQAADAFEGDCYVRKGMEWQNGLSILSWFHEVPAVRLFLDGSFMNNDAAPLSAIDAVQLTGQKGTTTLSLLNLGDEPVVRTIGVSFYDSSTAQWSSTHQVNVGSNLDAFGQRFYIEVPVPAKDQAGCYTDSIAVTEVNGYPCPHSQMAVPITVNVLSQSLKHTHLVRFDLNTTNGFSPRAEVGRQLLEQAMGDDVITYVNHWGDHMIGHDKYPPLNVPGIVLDGKYQNNIDPYYGFPSGSDGGFGLADYIRSRESQPSFAEISATAAWLNESHTSLRFTSTIHTLVDLPADRLSVRYVVVADGLHGTGDRWGQPNALSGTSTDDPNLQPLTLQPAIITDYVFDGVGIFCPHTETISESGQEQHINVPAMKANSSIELQQCLTADPDEYGNGGYALFTPDEFGIDYSKMHVIAFIEDNLTSRIVNCARVALPVTPPDGLSSPESEEISEPVIYNLQGIRVHEPTAPGLYLVNGRKVFILSE